MNIRKIIEVVGSNKLYAIHFHNAIAKKGHQIMFYIIKIGNGKYYVGGSPKSEGTIMNFEGEINDNNPSLPQSIINEIDASPEGLDYLKKLIAKTNNKTNQGLNMKV